MKRQGMLALVFFSSLLVSGAATSATARSGNTLRASRDAFAQAANGASLDVSQVGAFHAAVERRVLLERLGRAEALTKAERQALQAQQQVLFALETEQEGLEDRVQAMEASERTSLSDDTVLEKGTVSNSAGKTPLVRQEAHVVQQPQAYEVAKKAASAAHAGGFASKKVDNNHQGFVILMRNSEAKFWAKYNQAFWEKMIGIAVYITQIFIVAFLYLQFCKHSVAPKLPESQVRKDEFQFGPFDASDILRDCQMCVCAMCCPWIRWADTASAPHISFLAFMPALFIAALLSSAGTVTFGLSIPILLLVVVLCRQRIRESYGLEAGTCGILFGDCLLWICCPCCAIVQEARQVEFVEFVDTRYGEFGNV